MSCAAAVLLLGACDTEQAGSSTDFLVRAPYVQDLPGRFHNDVVWTSDGIYTAGLPALALYTVGADFRPTSEAAVFDWPNVEFAGLTTVAVDAGRTHAVSVAGRYDDGVAGSLHLIDLRTRAVRQVRDSTWNVSDARFIETGPLGRPGRILFYAFGYSPQMGGTPGEAGYYIFDPDTGRDSLILAATSRDGVQAGVHAFDVSPDGRTLIGPDYRSDAAVRLTVADFATSPVASRPVEIETALGADARSVAVRFHPDGAALAYVANPFGPTPEGFPGSSDIGTIRVGAPDGSRWTVTPRDSRPYGSARFIARKVTWSPDGRHLAYLAAPTLREYPFYTPNAYSVFVGTVAP